ncbi:hypothetical protein B0I37DRAFT_217248 [Chaetomium sp. MPI-CAGE-AT-0009]|nr:hypothetical protein B0I37DRAFT_217248 [Chaetomium sp. MPI-CAGE-AT-0009]
MSCRRFLVFHFICHTFFARHCLSLVSGIFWSPAFFHHPRGFATDTPLQPFTADYVREMIAKHEQKTAECELERRVRRPSSQPGCAPGRLTILAAGEGTGPPCQGSRGKPRHRNACSDSGPSFISCWRSGAVVQHA